MARLLFALTCLWSCFTQTAACSNFMMENGYHLSVRTMDLGTIPLMQWTIVTIPEGSKGLRSSKYGYVGVAMKVADEVVFEDLLFAGINNAGVTCDLQTLIGSKYPDKSSTKDNIDAAFICRWVLEGFGSVAEVKQGLQSVQLIEPTFTKLMPSFGGAHWVIRDASGQGLVIEFLDGTTHLHDDNNDQGKTAFGIMTNEPPFPWHVENVKHLQWKQSTARSAVVMPGNWYPDERFLRIHLVKSSMPKPRSYDEAVAQAVHTLNTITVPMGTQIGTDSGKGEGAGDHTQFGLVYDHKNKVLYWRSQVNQNLQRLRLEDAGITGSNSTNQKQLLEVFSPKLDWFADAASKLSPRKEVLTSQVTV